MLLSKNGTDTGAIALFLSLRVTLSVSVTMKWMQGLKFRTVQILSSTHAHTNSGTSSNDGGVYGYQAGLGPGTL